jgi:hypothetical protein
LGELKEERCGDEGEDECDGVEGDGVDQFLNATNDARPPTAVALRKPCCVCVTDSGVSATMLMLATTTEQTFGEVRTCKGGKGGG